MNIQQDIKRINWSNYQTAYGAADSVGDLLIKLAGSNQELAHNASHSLWAGLCHQHAYISSAAEPALSILLKVFENADSALRVELLDIFVGFAAGSIPSHPDYKRHSWVRRFRFELLDVQGSIKKHIDFDNEEEAGLWETFQEYLSREIS